MEENERLARIEAQLQEIYRALMDGKLTERVIKLESQMSVLKWAASSAWAVALSLIGYLFKKVM
jgi:hypothetical protein